MTLDILTRLCIGDCKTVKDKKAFVGNRKICRACWYYLSNKEKKTDNFVYVNYSQYLREEIQARDERLARAASLGAN